MCFFFFAFFVLFTHINQSAASWRLSIAAVEWNTWNISREFEMQFAAKESQLRRESQKMWQFKWKEIEIYIKILHSKRVKMERLNAKQKTRKKNSTGRKLSDSLADHLRQYCDHAANKKNANSCISTKRLHFFLFWFDCRLNELRFASSRERKKNEE